MDKLNSQRLVIMQNMALGIMKYKQEELDKLAKSLSGKSVKMIDEKRNDRQGDKVGQMLNSVNMKMCLKRFNKDLIKTGMSFRED